ncbi:BlaI/MecI/CopY family transcriptional regulator [Terasakiella pusilla]|uniref:BlaI/MecI/CopY family transcriptional regulator n=1 Tax=Terasakiella pusilla TaxID=64973 RepID=UPI003AA82B94
MQLGELETLVLNFLFDEREANAKQVHQHFAKERGGSLNTIQSTLDRLFKKGLLGREKQGHAFVYSPALNRKTLLGNLISNITAEFAKDNNDTVLEAFVDVSSELDGDNLERLEKLISAKKRSLQGGQ